MRTLWVEVVPFHIWENWGPEKGCSLAKNTQQQRQGYEPRPIWHECFSPSVTELVTPYCLQQMNQTVSRWITKLPHCPVRSQWPKGWGWWGRTRNSSVVRNISFSPKHLELGQTRHWQIGKWIIYIWLRTGMGMGTDWVSEHPLWESCLDLEA